MTGFVYLVNMYILYDYSLRLEKGKTTVSVSPIRSLHWVGVSNEATMHCLQNAPRTSVDEHVRVCMRLFVCVCACVCLMWFVLCTFVFRSVQWTTCGLLVHVDLLWSDHYSILDHEDKSNAALTIELVHSSHYLIVHFSLLGGLEVLAALCEPKEERLSVCHHCVQSPTRAVGLGGEMTLWTKQMLTSWNWSIEYFKPLWTV